MEDRREGKSIPLYNLERSFRPEFKSKIRRDEEKVLVCSVYSAFTIMFHPFRAGGGGGGVFFPSKNSKNKYAFLF